MLLKQVSEKAYKKVKTPADQPLIAELQISGEIHGITCFRVNRFVEISNDDYNRGYITLDRRPSTPVGVVMMAVDGPILVNKAANGPWADFEVYDKYLFFRNGVSAGGYTSSGLTEIVTPGDEYIIQYGFSSTSQLKQYSFTITNTDVSRGYAILPHYLVSPEYCMGFVVGGTTLTNGLCSGQGDFVVWGNKFIFKNGVDVLGYTSSGLSELIQEGDTIVLLYI